MVLIAFLYFVTGIVYVLYEIGYILKNQRIQLISAFRVMYSFSYGFFPAIMCYRSYLGISKINGFDESYIPSLLVVLIVSIIQYVIFSLAYKATKKSRFFYKPYKVVPYDKLKIAGLIITVLATISIILWSRAFGSVWNFIIQADAVRARYSSVYNPFAFMEHVSKVIFFATFVFLALFMYQKGAKNKISNFLFLLISLMGSLLILLMTDGRGIIAMLIMTIAFYVMNYRLLNGKKIKYEIVRIGIIAISAFLILLVIEPVLWYIRFGVFLKSSNSTLFEIIEKEFSFIVVTRKVVLDNWYNMNIDSKFFAEVLNTLTAWIPSRFIPFDSPIGLWDYNTLLISTFMSTSGQSPTDFVSASIYLFGLLGIFILPFLWGMILKKIETSLQRAEHNYYLDIIYFATLQRMLQLPTHFSLYNHVLLMFYLFLGHLIVVIISKIQLRKGSYNG
jgi:hypothetical protein